jgi:hypothetical protein
MVGAGVVVGGGVVVGAGVVVGLGVVGVGVGVLHRGAVGCRWHHVAEGCAVEPAAAIATVENTAVSAARTARITRTRAGMPDLQIWPPGARRTRNPSIRARRRIQRRENRPTSCSLLVASASSRGMPRFSA